MKTNALINAAIVGCGRIAPKHIEAINALEKNGARIRCASDPKIDNLKNENLMREVLRFPDFRAPDFMTGIDLAVILTESGNHYENAKYFLESGIDVLIEKPVTLRLDHALDLKRLAITKNRKIYVVKQNRFNHPIKLAKKFCDDGFLGKPQIGTIRVRWCRPQEYYDLAPWRGTWAMDGGVISNQASHHIDLLRWFMGEVHSVRAFSRKFSANIEAEDTLVAALEFSNGALGTIEATTTTRPRNLEGSLSVQGHMGAFEVSGHAVNHMRFMQSAHPDFNEVAQVSNAKSNIGVNDVYGSGHRSIYEEILKDRLGLVNSAVTLDDAIESLKLIHLLYLSVEQDRTVLMSELGTGSARLGISKCE